MFSEIGHHVEKIRRVGYGPLVLDIEPGKMRELEPEELEDLRKAADGKLGKPKPKDIRRRKAMDAQLPTLRRGPGRPPAAPASAELAPVISPPRREFPPKKQFGTDRPSHPERLAKAKAFVPGRNAQGPVQSGSAHRDLAHRDPGHHVAARHVLGRHNLVPAANRGSPRGGRTIALLRPSARFGRAPTAIRAASGAVWIRAPAPRSAGWWICGESPSRWLLAPSRRNRGRSPVPIVPIVQTVQPSNPTPAPRRDAVPDREEVKAPQTLSRLQIEAVEPERESPTRPHF